MTNEQILKKVIEKAKKNGLKCSDTLKKNIQNIIGDRMWFKTYFLIIFSHDFAKAFWGEELLDKGYKDFESNEKYLWGSHLKTMVLEPEPLKYLEKFL